MASNTEDAKLNLEGWNEALLTRKDEDANYVKPKIPNWKKEDISKHLETNLFLTSTCLVEDKKNNLSFEVKYKNKDSLTKLEVGCACNRDFTEDEVKALLNKEKLFSHEDCPLPTNVRNYKEVTQQLNATLEKYEINTCLQKAHFIAQIEAESDHFNTSLEYANGWDYDHTTHKTKYDNYSLYLKDEEKHVKHGTKANKAGYNRYKQCISNGHNVKGYGPKYKGKGLIQITWHSVHKKYFNYLGKPDWISTPDKISKEIKYTFDSAGWYWRKGSAWGDVNKKAENDDFISVCVAINGGLNGFKHRKKNLKRILKEMRVKEKCTSLNNKSIGTYKYDTSAIKKSKYGRRNKKTIQSYDD